MDTASPLVVVDRGTSGSFAERDLRLHEALECTLDCHCTDKSKPVCDSGTGDCVEPCVDKDCTDSQRSVCDAKLGRCMPKSGKECTKAVDCDNPSRPRCGADGICAAPAALCQELKKDPTRVGCDTSGGCVVYNPRFIFRDLEVHNFEVRPVGLVTKKNPVEPRVLGGLLGVPLLQHFTVRLDYSPTNPTLTLLNGIPDSTEELADDCVHADLASTATAQKQRCLAVIGTPRVGGGLIEFNTADGVRSTELKATRITVPLCLMPGIFDRDKVKAGDSAAKALHGAATTSGVPAHAVVATGLGTSVMARSVYNRLKAYSIIETPGATLHLPYGKESVSTVTLARVAVVSSETRWLGPCGELALRRRLVVAPKVGITDEDKALLNDRTFNGASAAVLTEDPATVTKDRFTITFAVVDDKSALLQGLRNELRPQTPDVDVVLGGSVLKNFVLEVDYPGNRTILACPSHRTPAQCEMLPFCAHPDNSDLTKILCPMEASKK